jgi:hypothetical protein
MDRGVIEVETKFFVLAFLLLFFKPRIEIDGGPPREHPWGVSGHPVAAPGRHRVTVYVPYLFFSRMGESSVDVDVAPGQAVRVQWNAPWITFMAGRIEVMGAGPAPAGALGGPIGAPGGAHGPQGPGGHQGPPALQGQGYGAQGAPAHGHSPAPAAAPAAASGGAAAGWYPDPSSAHQLRYFDGSAWTSHVSDNGVVSNDAR